MADSYTIADIPIVCEDFWALSTTYEQNSYVQHNSLNYKCLVGHTSGSTSEPGIGVDWETYWEEKPTHYAYDMDRWYAITDTADPAYDAAYFSRWGVYKKIKAYCWKLCPYSTQWYDRYSKDGYYRTMKKIGNTRRYIQWTVSQSEQKDHSLTLGMMRYHQPGSKAGFICDDPDCPFRSINPGTGLAVKFFEV